VVWEVISPRVSGEQCPAWRLSVSRLCLPRYVKKFCSPSFYGWCASWPSLLWHCWLGGRKGIQSVKQWGDGGGGHWLVRMEWRPARWSVCLPLLIFPCAIKYRSSYLPPAHPGGPGKRAVKRLWWWFLQLMFASNVDNGMLLKECIIKGYFVFQAPRLTLTHTSCSLNEVYFHFHFFCCCCIWWLCIHAATFSVFLPTRH